MSLWGTYLPNGDKVIEIAGKFVKKTGKCGDTRVANLVEMIIKEPKTLSYNLLRLTTVQIEEEVENLCAAQDLNDSKRNTLVAEREVSNSTLPCYIPFFLDNIVEELTRNMILIKPG